MHQWLLTAGMVLGIMALTTAESNAVDFRIDTKLFAGGNKTPTGQNLTLFAGGAVFDFARELNPQGEAAGPQEIAILDTQRLRFVLMDTSRQVRTEIDCSELGPFVERLRSEARGSNNPVIKFSAEPQFTENFTKSSGLLTLTSGVIDYRVETVRPDSAAAADQYGLFADWYAKLNTTHPGAAPPFPRTHLNAVLVKHGVIPTRVERTLSQGSQKSTAWTEHQVSWQLTRTDRQQITQAEGFMVNYKEVSFGEYRRIEGKK